MARAYTPFTPLNFPQQKNILNSGSRTQYPMKSEYNDQGFFVGEDTELVNAAGRSSVRLSAGSRVYFVPPIMLLLGQEIGQRSGYWAAVSTKSSRDRADGYVNVSRVIKPAGSAQARVKAGSETQKNVALEVQRLAASKGQNPPEKVSEAKPGSTAPDLIMKMENGKNIQFEIKGTNSSTAPITLFDKSVSRKRGTPEPIDDLAVEMIPQDVKREMTKLKYPISLVGAIDYFRSKANLSTSGNVGLAGDEGTPSSGKIPSIFTTTDSTILARVRRVLIEKFQKGGDDFFVIEDRSSGTFKMYFVGRGSNVLGVPELPPLKSFALDTYGGASSGSTRVGLKIKL